MGYTSVMLTLLALPGALIAWTAWSLEANRTKAKQAGFPVLVRWITPTNPLWMVYGSSVVKLCRALNLSTKNFSRFYSFGWEAKERHRVHQEIGDIFMLVTPGGNWLCVSDAKTIYDILQRRTDFRRNIEQMSVLNVYGKNLSTTDDHEWQKHRKVTAVTFTEKNNALVWQQSLTQAAGMLEYWTKRAPQPIRTISQDTKVFTLNVLAAALFSKEYPFESEAESKEKSKNDQSYQYRDSLSKILKNIIPIFVFGPQVLKSSWMPNSWREAGEAVTTFQAYVVGLINEEKTNIAQGGHKNQHLVASLVRACETTQQEEQGYISKLNRKENTWKSTLTEEEIISNLFVYAFAGNDTTAIALAHLLVNLAAFPSTQEWIAEEILYYFPSDDPSHWNFDTFPKLKRCLAVLMETLRLCHPLGQLVKMTGDNAQTLQVGSKMHTIPAGTAVHLSMSALQTHPKYWGEDPMKWYPERFISTPDGAPNSLTSEVIQSDTSDNFLPWAYGQRTCPGKRFSQVELVATLSTLFRNHRLHPEPEKGETLEQARSRIFASSLDVEHEGKILHEMSAPETIGLKWTRVK